MEEPVETNTNQEQIEKTRRRSNNYLPLIIGSAVAVGLGIYVHRKLRKSREATVQFINNHIVSNVLTIANDNKYKYINAILHMISHEPLINKAILSREEGERWVGFVGTKKWNEDSIRVHTGLSRILNGDPDLDGSLRDMIFSKYLTRSYGSYNNPHTFVDTFSKLMKDLDLMELFTFKYRGNTIYSGKGCKRYRKCPEAMYGSDNPERYELPKLYSDMSGECNVMLDQLCSHTNNLYMFPKDELPELPELLFVKSSSDSTIFRTFDVNINNTHITTYKLVARCACIGYLLENSRDSDSYDSDDNDNDYDWVVDIYSDKYDPVWITNGKAMSGKDIMKIADEDKQSVAEFGLYRKGSTYTYTNMFY